MSLRSIHTHSHLFERYLSRVVSGTNMQPEMHDQTLQSHPWPPPEENSDQSSMHLNAREQPRYPQTHHSASSYSHPVPHGSGGAISTPIRRNYWTQYDLGSNGMTAPLAPAFTSTASPAHNPHIRYVDYGYMQHPHHDRLNNHPLAGLSAFEPVSSASSATLPISPKPIPKSEPTTHNLPDNQANLEKMRHERELMFRNAAAELDQARYNTSTSVSRNRAWEDAWEVMRESMTKM
ncbi:hypothetical protein AUEXF2481DRAFT_176108 [Aureobasidium subglaciale EXF-2481]|uniref:Uncharacterized protein n=1 Tax=Aureobasidium subglaciale (strain EXF-2481) TaxID=1043005 RepID=A0A074ZLY5_AURSE|nr:uncharacterized protein AUEXF2481DRAFT_176108 [Aureobasidium subglaciale EXF-2481]KEQ99411.1 hypothetical protein AUEXF2481DRAFT_176108 [Aureobasidium subglaciale EXF-2481]